MSGKRFEFLDLRSHIQQQTFAEHVREGLSADQKWLSPRFFYDERGSELFERITRLPEYYPFDAERAILESSAHEIVSHVRERGSFIELGSGSSVKTRIILEAALEDREELHYVPVDISADFLRSSSRELIDRYEGLNVTALAGTYEVALERLPDVEGPRVFLFLGGNIGNYTPSEARKLLSGIGDVMKSGDRLMVGIDLLKESNVIERAYNDEQGVTAAFNKNILFRINRELDGEFDPVYFRHHAPFIEEKDRVEMRLISKREQSIPVHSLGKTFHFSEGEYIHTENSQKFDTESFQNLCRATGLEMENIFRDERNYFAEVLLS